ncbi:MAG TPA: potassium transporter TrkA [Phycisphaerales bacterium]|nr:potassium transporter TrkA [Phycisphaerales bacterium]
MPLIVLFIIAFLALLMVRIGATALMMTGLTREVAEFQALSCFFGVGFTTRESEMIVSHPVRRKIASHLIITGNLGVTGAIGTLIVTFLQNNDDWLISSWSFPTKLVVAGGGVSGLFFLFRIGFVRRMFERVIRSTLDRSGAVRILDYEMLLRAGHGYVVSEYEIDPGHPLVGKTLGEAGLGSRGVLVLGIERDDGSYVGTPKRKTVLRAGDVLTVYGLEENVRCQLDPEANCAAADEVSGTECHDDDEQ